MQTSAFALAVLAAAAAASAAEPSPTPSGAPAAAPTPQFTASDFIPDRAGHDDAGALYELRLGGEAMTADQQIARWQAELKAGRARAGSLAGSQLGYVALTTTDCAVARDVLTQADTLGSDQAPWLLAQLAENRSCGEPDVAARERWLKKAVTLDYFAAVQQLIALYSPTGAKTDAVQQYTYARIAGGYWEAVYGNEANPGARAGFDVAALQEMEKTLSADDRKRAETEATQVLKQMLKRHDRFKPARPQEFGRGGKDEKASSGWGYVASTIDYYHECTWNLANNCRGAQRLAFADIINHDAEFMACKVGLKSKDFVTGKAGNLSREVLMGPKATRRLILGDLYEQPDKSAMTVDCKVIPRLADNSAAGRCKAKLVSSIDAQRFYPPAAKNAGIEGDVVVRYYVPAGATTPVDAEIVRSSGYTSLDDAAIDTIRSGQYSKDCDYGLSSIRIAFKLQD